MASIYQVARRAKVSPATVSRVFNHRGNVAGEAEARVLAAAKALGYTPQQSARRDAVGVVMAPFETLYLGGYSAALLTALARAMHRRRLSLELIGADEVESRHDQLLAGVVLTCQRAGDAARRFAGCGVVAINNRFPGITAVCSDEAGALRAALGHLAARGWRRPALLLLPAPGSSHQEREAGFAAAAVETGLRPAGVWRGGVGAIEGQVAAALAAGADALVAGSELIGPPVLAALHRLGRRPGAEVAVIGWEVLNLSEHLVPALTAIAQDLDGLAEAALDRLLGAARGDLLLPCALLDRASVPPAP